MVTIFSQEDIHPPLDEQTKYVRLEGEFAHGGIYSVSAGETLRSLVRRAGGLTANAYLYGAEFTRKSTQALEQQRLDEYVDRIAHQMERNSINQASAVHNSRATNSGCIHQSRSDCAASPGSCNRKSGAGIWDPIARERTHCRTCPLRMATGWWFRPCPPRSRSLALSTIQNAFLYHGKNARVGDYLHLAGGPSREADRRRAFILRANGTVTPREAGQSIFASSSFDKLRLYPGDSIVVPEKNVRPSTLSQILGWSQFISGYSIDALLVNSLK